MTSDEAWALPTWMMTKAVCPFLPRKHPWKDRKFSLREWSDGRTLLCKALDLLFWVGWAAELGLLMSLFFK